MEKATDAKTEGLIEIARVLGPVFPVAWVVSTPTGRTCSCGRVSCSRPAKHPVFRNWQKLALGAWLDLIKGNENKLRAWHASYPRANWGLLCGVRATVVDVDIKDGAPGLETLKMLETEHSILPQSWRAQTGSGGYHIYLLGTGKSTKLPGIDIQGEGKYVLLPGSENIAGSYFWTVRSELESVPRWVLDLGKSGRVNPHFPSKGDNPITTVVRGAAGDKQQSWQEELTEDEISQLMATSRTYLKLADTLDYNRGAGSKYPLTDKSPSGYEFSLANYAAGLGWTIERFIALCWWWRRRHGLERKAMSRYKRTWAKVSTTCNLNLRANASGHREAPKGAWKWRKSAEAIMVFLHAAGPSTPSAVSTKLGISLANTKQMLSRMARNLHTPCSYPVGREAGRYTLTPNGVSYLEARGLVVDEAMLEAARSSNEARMTYEEYIECVAVSLAEPLMPAEEDQEAVRECVGPPTADFEFEHAAECSPPIPRKPCARETSWTAPQSDTVAWPDLVDAPNNLGRSCIWPASGTQQTLKAA